MVEYLLDTDIIVYALNNKHGVGKKILQYNSNQLGVSMIAFSELLYGAYNSTHCEKNLRHLKSFVQDIQVIPFCEKAAETFGQHKAALRKKGTPVDDMDLMIASTAIVNKMTLISNNTKHFSKIPKLKLDNWCDHADSQ